MAVKKLLRKEAVTNKAIVFKFEKSNKINMAKNVPKELTFIVYKDEDGILCASTKDEKSTLLEKL